MMRIYRWTGRIAATILCAAFFAAAGGFAAWHLGDTLIDMRLIQPNGNIDDDAAILNMGVALVGAALSLIAGMIAGWRLTRRLTSER